MVFAYTYAAEMWFHKAGEIASWKLAPLNTHLKFLRLYTFPSQTTSFTF